ncbi:MAG: FG-GAP-like repeat-containing protein [Cyanobacteria bacterium P01_F01_bin.143]
MMLLTDKNYLPQKQTTMLVVIDPTVEAPHKLAEGVQTGASVLLLNPNFDSIAQITTALAARNYGSLHLISHGSPGRLHLGKTNLNSDNIAQYKQQLLEWRIAEILIYGCNVAANPDLLIKLHVLTGANIAASAQEVGQGNWNLEWQKIGEITSGSAFAEELRQEYQGKFIGFLPQVTFAAGNRPNSLAIGDLDGDGSVDDLAVANNSSVNVSVLLGDGSGGFSAQTTFAVGDTPFSVAIGDLDGDGSADDLAVANLGSDTVSVLLGDGSGGFSAQTTFAVGIDPRSVAIGDLDGDGSADDLAVANDSSANVSVLLGDGSGGFSAQTTFAAGISPQFVAIGDLDGDGSADDLAIANINGNVSVFLGDGSGGFSTQTTFAVGTNSRSVAIGDLDGDGSADDLVVTNDADANVSVLLGDGSGGFSTQTTFAVGTTPRSVAIGDLDGDGSADDGGWQRFVN